MKTSSVVTTRYALRHAPMGFPVESRAQVSGEVATPATAGTASPFIESAAATYRRPRRRSHGGGRIAIAACTLAMGLSAYAAFSFVS